MIDAKDVRFALWLMPGLGDDPTDGVTQLAKDMITWRGPLSQCINADEQQHWKQSLGTLAWNRLIDSDGRMVLTWAADGTAAASDDALYTRLEMARRALMLASEKCRHHDDSEMITGRATTIQPVRFEFMNGYRAIHGMHRPHYLARMAFCEGYGERFLDDPWFTDWLAWTKRLDAIAHWPDLLAHAAYSYTQAYYGQFLEFRLILYVRTAEFVLGLPAYKKGRPKNAPRAGAKTFAERALSIVPELSAHWYVKTKRMHERLMQLYRHRNACAHGLIPFEELPRDEDGGSDEAAQFEFIAEYLARACLRLALTHPKASEVFASRAALEAAWEDRSFP
jgi:hypothetical protein